MHLLQTESITVQHAPQHPFLTFPDLAMSPRDRILLLGESGSGKTSLLSVLAGLLEPDTGHVLINGQNLYQLPTKKRDRLRGQLFGFVFQSLHLIPSLTIAENILLAGRMTGVDIADGKLEALLSALSISGKASAKPSALSQGQQQRAAIARALIHSPQILIADEPTSALDDKHADAVMNLLDEQCRIVGAALIVATHDHRITHRFDKIISLSGAQHE